MGDVAKGIKSFKKGMASDASDEASSKNITDKQNTDNPDTNREDDKTTWKWARRFTVLDTISGVVAQTASPPKFVRWASDIKLKV